MQFKGDLMIKKLILLVGFIFLASPAFATCQAPLGGLNGAGSSITISTVLIAIIIHRKTTNKNKNGKGNAHTNI